MMTRDEHMQWCKDRAIKEIEFYKDGKQGIISMMSDLRKHPETDQEALTSLCGMQLMMNPNIGIQAAINFIKGFH